MKMSSLVRAIAIGVPILGAIPTAINVFVGWRQDIPWWDVPRQVENAKLWERNAGCKYEYKPFTGSSRTALHVAPCTKTGDLSLMITAKGRDPAYHWIAYDSLRKPGEDLSFFEHLIPPLNAAETGQQSLRVAQAAETAISVLCQKQDGKNIVRTLKQGETCYRETFSPFKGRVEQREDVDCATACPEPAKES